MSEASLVGNIVTVLVAALGGGLLSFLVTMVTVRAERRKINSEADINISTAWEQLVAQLRAEIERTNQSLIEERVHRAKLAGKTETLETSNRTQTLTIAHQSMELDQLKARNRQLTAKLHAEQLVRREVEARVNALEGGGKT